MTSPWYRQIFPTRLAPHRQAVQEFITTRQGFTAGLPAWGSCWGLQLATVALGGTVRRNPRGRELGVARAITATAAGRSHPLLAMRPSVFDALCSHIDEIEQLPPRAEVPAQNELCPIQALAGELPPKRIFFGRGA